MPPLPSGDAGDRHGEDEDDLGDDQDVFRPPLPPDDRIWRHPSEVAAATASARPSRPRWTCARSRRRGILGLVTVSGLLGATVSLGAVAVLGGFGRDTTVVERHIAVQPVTSTARDDDTVAAITARTAPSVAAIRVERGDATTAASALVMRSDGYLVTNAHLVDGADTIEVRLADVSVPATVVGTDRVTDIAVLHVELADLSPAVVGSARTLSMGDSVVAIAAAAGAGWSPEVTTGVVRGLGRRLLADDGTVLHDMILVDHPFPDGSGGGTLVDAHGAVVGLASDIPGATGDQRRGVAMPVDLAMHVADQIIDHGHARHVWLGIEGSDLSSDDALALGIAGGASIKTVVADSPAATAGLSPGDVVVALDGDRVESMSQLIAALRLHQPGDTISFTVRRDGGEVPLTVVLGERPG